MKAGTSPGAPGAEAPHGGAESPGMAPWDGATPEQPANHREPSAIEQLAQLEAIYRNAPVGMAVLDRELRFLRINERLAEINGLPAATHIGRTVRELLPAIADAAESFAQRVFETGQPLVDVPLSGETTARPGRVRHFVEQWNPLVDTTGAITGVSVVVEEVTQRLAAEEAMRESEARFRMVVQQGPAALAVLEGPDHVYTLVSPAYERWAGHGALTGRRLRDAMPELEGSPFDRAHQQVYATGEPLTLEEASVSVDRDGDGVPEDYVFTVHYTPLRNAAGAVYAVTSLVVDVTEQVRARQELETARRAGERSDAVLASIADAFYLLDREWRFTYVNDAAEPLLQTTREALIGRTLWEAFPGVIGSEFEGPYREAMATGRTTSAEAYFPPLGTWFDVRTYAWAGGLMVHFRDVGVRKAAESERERLLRALEVERARLEEVFRRAPSFIVAFRGAEHVYEFVNEAYYQLVGHREILGKPLLEAIPEIRGQGFDDVLDRVLRTGEPWVGRETPVTLQRTPDAPLEVRYLDMVFQALTEADGTRPGIVVHGSDITEQVIARREVERLLVESERARADADGARGEAETARAEAEAANRTKSEFLAVMSHELRTPLNAIGGYAELIEMGIRGPITPAQREDLRRIQTSQRHLLGLINEVLNYAKLETGAVHYAVGDVRVRDALAGAEALVAPQADAKGLALGVTGCPPSLVVRADIEKLRQILVNLLSNAVKFTDRGGRIDLSCEVVAHATGERVRILVRDTGIGIAGDQLGRIFEPFVQVRADFTRTAEGTGLGLAISRDLARGMAGDLTVDSTPGVGSTFVLTLPRA
jgi:PAS domain S-box-containing protein